VYQKHHESDEMATYCKASYDSPQTSLMTTTTAVKIEMKKRRYKQLFEWHVAFHLWSNANSEKNDDELSPYTNHIIT
jgi:hypothetical protein